MQRQDYIERMIQQLAQAIGNALGFAKAGNMQQAQDEIRRAWTSAVGLRRDDIMRLDAATLRGLLGEKRALAVMLLEAEVELGNPDAERVLAALRN